MMTSRDHDPSSEPRRLDWVRDIGFSLRRRPSKCKSPARGCPLQELLDETTRFEISSRTMRPKRVVPVCFPLLMLCAGPLSALAEGSPDSATEAVRIAEKVQSFYDEVQDLEAQFVQTFFRKSISRTTEDRGTLYVKKPGRFRWHYQKPYPRDVYVKDNTAWIHEPEEQQAYRQAIDPNAYAEELSFLTGEGEIAKSFVIASVDPRKHELEPGLVGLELRPRKPVRYTRLVLGVEPETGRVKTTILFLADGATPGIAGGSINRYDFRDIHINRGLKDGLFTFSPPKGTDILN